MILDEVHRFRNHVRQTPQAGTGGGVAQQQGSNVPIPDNANQWGTSDPRPQEASTQNGANDLENELQGMDMRQR